MPLTPPLLVRGLALLASISLPLTTQAADPGVGEWTTFGNGPSHSGFYPKTIGSASFTPGWNKTFSVPINPVAVSGDTIYATTNGYFTGGMRAFAMNATDGTEKWSYPLADAFSVNPPTYANGRVYFQRGNHGSDTHLWCLDAASGSLRFAAAHAAQWERYAAPTVADGGAL
jgi:outer membrane protein assembly factor BamB